MHLHEPLRGGVSRFFRCAAPLWFCLRSRCGIMPSIPPQKLQIGLAKTLEKQASLLLLRARLP